MTDRIQDAATAFGACIKALLHSKVDNINSNVATMREDVIDIKDDIVDVSKGVVGMLKQQNQVCRTLAKALADIQRDRDCS